MLKTLNRFSKVTYTVNISKKEKFKNQDTTKNKWQSSC